MPSRDGDGRFAGDGVDDAGETPGQTPDPAPSAPRSTDPDSLGSVLGGLDADGRLQVERLAPAYASGWLDDLVVHDGMEANVLEQIRTQYGGGTFRLRAKAKHTDGRLRYTAGSARVQIAGEPHYQGRRYVNGVLVDPVGSMAPAVAPVPIPQLAGASQDPVQMLRALAGILEHRQGAPAAPGAPPLQGIPELVTALSGVTQPQQQDAFSSLERAVKLIATIRGDGGGGGGGGDGDGDFGSSGMDDKFMMMLMGNQMQPQQPQQQPWGWGPPPGYPPQQPPPQQQTAPPPQQPQAPPQATPAPTPNPAPQANDGGAQDDDEPYTVEDVLAGVEELSDADKMNLLSRLGEVLPASLATEIQAHVAKMGGSVG